MHVTVSSYTNHISRYICRQRSRFPRNGSLILIGQFKERNALKVGRGRGDAGTWGRGDVGTRGRGDVGTWGRGDAGTWGLGDVGTWGTRGRGDSGTWYARTSELGDARGFEDVINK